MSDKGGYKLFFTSGNTMYLDLHEGQAIMRALSEIKRSDTFLSIPFEGQDAEASAINLRNVDAILYSSDATLWRAERMLLSEKHRSQIGDGLEQIVEEGRKSGREIVSESRVSRVPDLRFLVVGDSGNGHL